MSYMSSLDSDLHSVCYAVAESTNEEFTHDVHERMVRSSQLELLRAGFHPAAAREWAETFVDDLWEEISM